MEQHNKLDFSDQSIYIGLDIHRKSWTVSIYTQDFEHKTFSQNPDPKLLVNYLYRNFPGANYYSVYEAGYCGFWIHEALKKQGINNMVVNPADVPTKDKERKRKTNRVDCRKLAQSLRAGVLDPIYIPERLALEDRSLIRARGSAVKHQTRLKNQIKGMLCFYGVTIPEHFNHGSWSGHFIRWLESISMKNSTGTDTLQFYIDELKHYRTVIASLNRKIRALAKTDRYRDQVVHLTSIPGIGIITAMILLVELVDINRFRTLDHLASFVGLVPGEHSSGDDDTTTGITPRSHHYLRSILIECAWVAVRKDPALTMCYQQLIRHMIGQKAIIHIAKKLLNRTRYVLKNNQPYVLAVIE